MENWGQSVTGIVIHEGRVLLVRHTYGAGQGKLVIPGGYVNQGEAPQEAVKREFMEETGVVVEPREIVGIRFNTHDWYVAFRADYVSGTPVSDASENSEVVWLDVEEALARDDVPDLTKQLIDSARSSEKGLVCKPFEASPKYAPQSLFCL